MSFRLRKVVALSSALTLALALSRPAFSFKSKVTLTGGADSTALSKISSSLTEVMNALDSHDWASVQQCFSGDGLKSLTELADRTHLTNVNPLYETNLISLPGGGWEVRNLKVLVDNQGVPGNPYQYLVFTLIKEGLISDVRFALDQQQYANIVQGGEQLSDFACRQQILQFVEIFRTAYNRKDLDYLKQVYSDDALIIVGKVLQKKPGEPDLLEKSRLSRERIQFIRESKHEYLDKLEKVFAGNEYIKVNFSEIAVRRHPHLDLIYGVTLKQEWKTPTYSDTGWLFLMIDFRNQDQPVIHVRSWQPEKFGDGSVVSLGDFEIIE